MFSRDNAIGIALLGLCTVVAGALVWQIITGERLRYNGPNWLITVIGILFFGVMLYGLVGGIRRMIQGRRQVRQWPDPRTGRIANTETRPDPLDSPEVQEREDPYRRL